MGKWLGVGVVFGVMGMVVGGCSSSSPPPTVSTFCSELAQAECPSVTSLCSTVTQASCEAAVESQCQAHASAAQAQQRTFNPANTSACLMAIQGVYQTLNPNTLTVLSWTKLNGTNGTAAPGPGSPNDICEKVFEGNVGLNGNCTTSYQCTSGNICGSNGSCGVEADKGPQEGCADPGDLCDSSDVCTQEGKNFVCTTGIAVGGSCSDTNPCAVTAECTNGKCVGLAEPGEKCTTNDGTDGPGNCDPTAQNGGFCDVSGTGTCASGYTFGNGSADCSAFGGSK